MTPVYYFLFKSVNSSVYCPQHYDTGSHIHTSILFHYEKDTIMNVTIIGATGDIGSHVTQFAVRKGHTVNAFDISAANIAKLGEAAIEGQIL